MACGTGENFRHIVSQIGPSGTLIGTEYSESMLAQARRKIGRRGWENTRLPHDDRQKDTFTGMPVSIGTPCRVEPLDRHGDV